jgi:hypothetical protein
VARCRILTGGVRRIRRLGGNTELAAALPFEGELEVAEAGMLAAICADARSPAWKSTNTSSKKSDRRHTAQREDTAAVMVSVAAVMVSFSNGTQGEETTRKVQDKMAKARRQRQPVHA